jgi:hypothetical protein
MQRYFLSHASFHIFGSHLALANDFDGARLLGGPDPCAMHIGKASLADDLPPVVSLNIFWNHLPAIASVIGSEARLPRKWGPQVFGGQSNKGSAIYPAFMRLFILFLSIVYCLLARSCLGVPRAAL